MNNELVLSNIPKLPIHVGARNTEPHNSLCPLHYHDELEFLIVYHGDFAITVDEVEYIATPGDIVFINSGVPHKTHSVTPALTGLVQFRENDYLDNDITKIIKYSVRFNNLTDSKIKILKSRELFSAIDRIIVENEEKKKGYEIFIKSEVYQILAILYRMDILIDSEELFATKEMQKIVPALEYVNKSYAENVTLDATSAMLGFDPSYFCRMFKSATGATFTEYLNFVRICKAEKLLSRTQKSILDISEEVGFSSLSYFNRVFKKYRNCSPRSYRLADYKNV